MGSIVLFHMTSQQHRKNFEIFLPERVRVSGQTSQLPTQCSMASQNRRTCFSGPSRSGLSVRATSVLAWKSVMQIRPKQGLLLHSLWMHVLAQEATGFLFLLWSCVSQETGSAKILGEVYEIFPCSWSFSSGFRYLYLFFFSILSTSKPEWIISDWMVVIIVMSSVSFTIVTGEKL